MDQDPSDFARRQPGLTESEATLLLAQVGPNVIRTEQIRTVFHIIAETLREPTFVLLLVAGGLYLVLGSLGEGLFVCASAVVSLGMVILQETRSERALQALQALAEPDARVIRDGRQRRIPSRELVPDDIMLITAGERIAADGRITSAGVVTIDESSCLVNPSRYRNRNFEPPPALSTNRARWFLPVRSSWPAKARSGLPPLGWPQNWEELARRCNRFNLSQRRCSARRRDWSHGLGSSASPFACRLSSPMAF